jgi:hypothetical protein
LELEESKYRALLAVLFNLGNEDYVKTVLGEVDDFVRELQNVTDEELEEAKQLIRKFPQHPLVKSDMKRSEILRDFVVLVEDEFKYEVYMYPIFIYVETTFNNNAVNMRIFFMSAPYVYKASIIPIFSFIFFFLLLFENFIISSMVTFVTRLFFSLITSIILSEFQTISY